MARRKPYASDYRLYLDRRRGGEERWSLGLPKDARMRVPDGYLDGPIFFGGRDSNGKLHYRATAFLISTPTGLNEHGGMALVTARHNVQQALAEYGNVWLRFNLKDGGAMNLEVTAPWEEPDNPASDVAAVPFWPPADSEVLPIPRAWFVTDEIIETRGIGVGEELMIIGLFSHHLDFRTFQG